jgi:uncharacterized protein
MNSMTGNLAVEVFRGVEVRQSVPKPLGESNRLVSIDVLRGFALMGILLMNIQAFSMPLAAYFNASVYGDLTGANYWAWLIVHVLIDEKFMVIFAILFGAGIVLMTSRLEAGGLPSGKLHYRRMGWLILFGLMHAHLIWAGDILFDYALCGMLAFLMRKRAPRTLLMVALLLISVMPVGMTLATRGLRSASPERIAAMQAHWKPAPATLASELESYRGGWVSQMRYRVPQARHIALNAFLFRIVGLMLAGMALLKLGWFRPEFPKRVYWISIALALVIGLPLVLVGALHDAASGWHVRSWYESMQTNYWGSIVMSFGYIGMVMLAVRAQVIPELLSRLQAVGRTAFSNYILQSVICTTIFYGHGLGLFGRVSRVEQIGIVMGVWGLQIMIAPIWLQHFRFGPLEWAWRSLTYGRREPMRRAAGLDAGRTVA